MARAPYESSKCWRKAMALTVWVHRLSARLPADEQSGLGASLKKAAIAAAQQLADADGRDDVEQAIKHYEAALAALRELLTAGLICRRLGYLRGHHLRSLRGRAGRVESLIEDDLWTCREQADASTAKTSPENSADASAFPPRLAA